MPSVLPSVFRSLSPSLTPYEIPSDWSTAVRIACPPSYEERLRWAFIDPECLTCRPPNAAVLALEAFNFTPKHYTQSSYLCSSSQPISTLL
eukprot:600863-Rhodomonas_salina.1